MKSKIQLFKKAVIAPLLFISAVCFSHPVIYPISGNEKENPGSIEFIKSDGYMLVFEVNLNKLPEKGCFLKITNETGEVIYETKIKSSVHQLTYRIERNDLSKINFEFKGKDFRFNESFNLRLKVEEKIEVIKL